MIYIQLHPGSRARSSTLHLLSWPQRRHRHGVPHQLARDQRVDVSSGQRAAAAAAAARGGRADRHRARVRRRGP